MEAIGIDKLSNDDLLLQWRAEAAMLKSIKSREKIMRDEIVRRMFPAIQEGTQRVELGKGYKLKAVHKPNYKLDKDQAKVNAAIAAITATDNEGGFIAERLIKHKPELSKSEYKALLERAETGSGVAIACLNALQPILTIDPGSTELEIEAPK